jgi:hypothetical protein
MTLIQVKVNSTGQTGTMDSSEFDPKVFTQITPSSTSTSLVNNLQPDLATSVGNGISGILNNILSPIRYAAGGLIQAPIAAATGGKVNTYDIPVIGKILGMSDKELKALQDKQGNMDIGKTAIKAGQEAADAASYAIPFGKGANVLSKVLLPGAGVGALQGLSQEGATPESVLGNAALGAGGAALLQKILPGIGAKAEETITKSIPEQIMNGVFKEPIKATKSAISKGESLGQEALKKGLTGTTENIYNTAVNKLNNTEDQLQQLLMNSNEKVNLDNIRKTVQPMITDLTQAGNKTAADAILSRIDAIENANGTNIPASLANQIKRTLYDEVQKSYGSEASANIEGVKTIARGLKENIEKISDIPSGQISQLNKDLSFYGRTRNSMLDKMTREGRNNILGLTDAIIGGGGLVSGAGIPAAAVIASKKIAGSTLGKTAIANGLNKIGNIIGKVNVQTPVMQTILGQTGARLPSIFSSNQTNQNYNSQANPNDHISPILSQPNTSNQTKDLNDTVNHYYQKAGYQITPKLVSMAYQVLPEARAKRIKEAFDSQITTKQQDQIEGRANADVILSQLEDTYFGNNMAKGRLGGVLGGVLSQTGLAPDINAYQNSLKSIQPYLARAMGQVGNLTENEQKNAIANLAKITSTPQEAIRNFRTIRALMQLDPSKYDPQAQ